MHKGHAFDAAAEVATAEARDIQLVSLIFLLVCLDYDFTLSNTHTSIVEC